MSALQNSATTNWPDSWPSHQSNWPLTVMGPSGATPPSGREAENGSASGVFRQDEVYEVGIDRRPLLTSLRAKSCCLANYRTVFLNSRLISLLGVMKSVERDEFNIFSSAACSRSVAYLSINVSSSEERRVGKE